MKVNLDTFSNPHYNPGRSAGIVVLWYIVGRIFINTYLPWPMGIKRFVLKLFGAKIGGGVVIKPKVNIKYPWLLTVGNHSWIGEKVWIDNLVQITLGDNVCLSQGAMLLTGNHNYKKSTFDLITGEIVLEEGVWIGAQAVVCPGVTCKSHSILSVSSVATSHLEPYTIYQGNPAKMVRVREVEEL